MLKIYSKVTVAIAVILMSFASSFGQDKTFSKAQALDLVRLNAAALNLSAAEVNDAFVSDAYYNKTANTNMVYLQQGYLGVPLHNTLKVIAFRGQNPVSVTGRFINSLSQRTAGVTAQPAVTAASAVATAAAHVNRPVSESIVPVSSNNAHDFIFPAYNVSKENIRSKLMWEIAEDGKMNLVWQVTIAPVHSSDYWIISVDAISNTVLGKYNLTIYEDFKAHPENAAKIKLHAGSAAGASTQRTNAVNSAVYRVVPFPAESMISPGGAPLLVTNPWLNAGLTNPVATLGWHNDGTVDHDSTRGNNVWAREDRANTNGVPNPGLAAKSTTPEPDLTFDFPFNNQASPGTADNLNFATTQLFYWNNIMHDIVYQYGFDEVSGNFQNSNLGRGGVGGDYVIADAQDGGGTNNANFATPADGTRPRMQMYLWDPTGAEILKVNAPESIKGFKPALESNFSTANKLANVGPVTGDVVWYNTAGNDGCTALTGTPLQGKIAIIDRGSCNFVVKVKNAQLAGATAVIMVNNVAGNPIVMGGTDNTITIPAVMVSQDSGNLIKNTIANGTPVNVTLQAGVNLDGDLDNGIMAHEFTHGISTRLTGGPSTSGCLSNGGGNGEQMGEGWSDFYALVTTTDWQTAQVTDGPNPRPVGGYVYPGGLRNYPYSTDMNINPWTYDQMPATQGEVHNIGEIWTTVLWDMTWNLIQTNGINTNLYNSNAPGGNSVALKLVTEGMKLQPCRPGFLDGRDGILKADTLLYNGQNSCAIWKAFARRGMGIYASQGSSNSYTDGVADYTLPSAMITKTVDKVIADQNEELTYTLTAKCQCVPVTGYNIIDTLGTNVTYVSGGTYNASNRTVTFSVPSLTEGQNTSYVLKVKVNPGTYTAATTPLNEPVATAALPATFTTTSWATSTTRAASGAYSLKAAGQATASTKILTSASSYPVTGISTLSFWHYYDTQTEFDGGYVELSTDNGTTWFDAGPYIYKNGYTGSIVLDSKLAFTGSSNAFIQTLIKLSPFAGKQVQVRFVFETNASVTSDGWYIDDITIKNESGVYNLAGLYDANSQLVTTADTATLITANLPLVWGGFTAQKEGATALLKWSTMQEQNTKEFVIERSRNGQSFERIGTVNAAGNATSQSNYAYTDIAPLNGVNYYRIRQVDLDNHFTNSDIRSLVFDKTDADVTIAPNPAKDRIVITIPGNRNVLQVTIFTVKGEKAGSFIINGSSNKLDIPGYAAGVYYVKIAGENLDITRKLVIK